MTELVSIYRPESKSRADIAVRLGRAMCPLNSYPASSKFVLVPTASVWALIAHNKTHRDLRALAKHVKKFYRMMDIRRICLRAANALGTH